MIYIGKSEYISYLIQNGYIKISYSPMINVVINKTLKYLKEELLNGQVVRTYNIKDYHTVELNIETENVSLLRTILIK